MSTKTLYRTTDKAEMLARIERLKADSPAQWGKMNVAQMMAHLQVALRVALGDVKIKRVFIGYLFGGIAKRKLVGPGIIGRNLPTGREFVFTDARDFTREKKQLLELVERFASAGPAGLSKDPHPFFGPLNQAEWEALTWKHLDHHLRQFGSA